MQKKVVLPLVLIILLVLLACSIGYEGAVFNNDEELNKQREHEELVQMLAQPSEATEIPAPPVASEPQPVIQPTTPISSESISVPVVGTEYAVTSQNFDCICQETGTVTQEFKFVGDQLELEGQLYDKTGDNSYRRSWMGYYILVSGEGTNKTETKVDEERSVVVTLTDTGYRMEHFQGNSGSPCCIHTFTKNN